MLRNSCAVLMLDYETKFFFLDLSIPVLLMLKHKLCCLPFDIRLTAFKEIFISLGRNLIIFQKKIVYFWLNRFLRHISFVENFVPNIFIENKMSKNKEENKIGINDWFISRVSGLPYTFSSEKHLVEVSLI